MSDAGLKSGPALIRIEDAAKLSGIPRSSLYRLASQNRDDIPHELFLRVGGRVWVRAAVLRRWLSDSQASSQALEVRRESSEG